MYISITYFRHYFNDSYCSHRIISHRMLECEYLIGEGGSRGYCMTRGKVGGGEFIFYTFGVEGVRKLYRGFWRNPHCVTAGGFIFFCFKIF